MYEEMSSHFPQVIEMLGTLAWMYIIGSFLMFLVCLGIFVWFANRIFDGRSVVTSEVD